MSEFSDAVPRDRRRGLKKPAIFLLGALMGISLWHWRMMANAPVWVIRWMAADRGDIYLGKTNSIPNRALVQSARQYLSELAQSSAAGPLLSSAQFESLGIRFDPKWFARHRPETVDYNPFASQGNFSVAWKYKPGCERVLRKIPTKPGPEWFDIKGAPCYSGYTISVLMDPNMKLADIKLTPITDQ